MQDCAVIPAKTVTNAQASACQQGQGADTQRLVEDARQARKKGQA